MRSVAHSRMKSGPARQARPPGWAGLARFVARMVDRLGAGRLAAAIAEFCGLTGCNASKDTFHLAAAVGSLRCVSMGPEPFGAWRPYF